MGSYPTWKLHTQIRLHSAGKIPKHSKISHIGINMEINIMAKNLHFSLASSLEQNPNLGQSQKMGIHRPLNVPPFPLAGRNHGAPPK
jgi:hypothetical protein